MTIADQAATPTAIVLPPRSENGHAMLNNLSEQIRDCLQHAEDCARKAAAQPDGSQLRQDFQDMEQRWLALAQSYDFTQRLGDFSGEAKRRADNLYSGGQRAAVITPILQGQASTPKPSRQWERHSLQRARRLG